MFKWGCKYCESHMFHYQSKSSPESEIQHVLHLFLTHLSVSLFSHRWCTDFYIGHCQVLGGRFTNRNVCVQFYTICRKEHEKHGSSCVKVKRNVCKKKNHSLTQSSIYKTNDRKYSQAILVITSFFMQKMSINVSSLSKVEIFFRFYIKTKTFKDNVFNK